METQQPLTFESTENQNVTLEKNVCQPEGPDGQNPAPKNVPLGYVYTDHEDLKQFYLALAPKMCPSVTSEHTELQQLRILYTRIRRTCKLLTVLDLYPWGEASPLLMKACGFFMAMDGASSNKDKRKLNDLLYMQATVMAKLTEFHDLISHDLVFFSRIKNDLTAMLNIGKTEGESD